VLCWFCFYFDGVYWVLFEVGGVVGILVVVEVVLVVDV